MPPRIHSDLHSQGGAAGRLQQQLLLLLLLLLLLRECVRDEPRTPTPTQVAGRGVVAR
jgi:hypothetical protein